MHIRVYGGSPGRLTTKYVAMMPINRVLRYLCCSLLLKKKLFNDIEKTLNIMNCTSINNTDFLKNLKTFRGGV